MANTALDALAGEDIVASNSLGTIMRNCVVLKGAGIQTETVISLGVISSVKSIRTTYPGLLVIAASAFLIAAAAASSKQGGGAAGPIAILAALFVLAYWLTRRASVVIMVGAERTESVQGSPREAKDFLAAVHTAMDRNQCPAA